MTLYRLLTLVPARSYAQCIAGMIIQDRKRVTPSFPHREIPLEIHLPEVVRPLSLKPLPRLVLLRVLTRYPAVALQYLRDSARRRHSLITHTLRPPLELTPSPCGALVPEGQNHPLHPCRSSVRGVLGPPRTLTEPLWTLFPVTLTNLISRLPAYPETATELRERCPLLQCQCNKFYSLRHYRNPLPSHGCLLSHMHP